MSVDLAGGGAGSPWVCRRASEVPLAGEEISAVGSQPAAFDEASGWLPAVVPGTVLTTLVANGVYPDPAVGMNNLVVPDIYHAGRGFYTFWFCRAFATPPPPRGLPVASVRWFLSLEGVNYSFELYVNGARVPVADGARGMFRRRHLDLTAHLSAGRENRLAMLVHPPDHVGCTDAGGQGGDHGVARDVEAQFVEGWDWAKPVRDRDTGIWGGVGLEGTGPVQLRHLHVRAVLSAAGDRAEVHATVEVVNGTMVPQACRLAGWLAHPAPGPAAAPLATRWSRGGGGARETPAGRPPLGGSSDDAACTGQPEGWCAGAWGDESLVVPPGATVLHVLKPLAVPSPQLWWPRGMGGQPLYEAALNVTTSALPPGAVSHEVRCRVGMRRVESVVDEETGGRLFMLNGRRVFVRGGNWIAADGMLRLSDERYRAEVRLHADANLNMLRLWGGAGVARPAFFDECDAAGLLVWVEFWVTGDCNGRGVAPSKQGWPLDHDLFLACAADYVKAVRNSPCVALFVGGNEQKPAPDLDAALGKAVFDLCPGVAYVSGSLWGGFGKGDGTFSDGPYGVQEPAWFFREDYYPYGFNPEVRLGGGAGAGSGADGPAPQVGSVGVPEAATIRATMPDGMRDPPRLEVVNGVLAERESPYWAYHTFMSYAAPEPDPAKRVRNQVCLYGSPKGLDEYCARAQIANFVQYRALLEGYGSKMWRRHTGCLVWKTQNPWPGLRGQFYDHLLDVTGALYGARCACEPVHVQLNLDTRHVEVVNCSPCDVPAGGRAEVSVHLLGGGHVERSYPVGALSSGSSTVLFPLPPPPAPLGPEDVAFVFLRLWVPPGPPPEGGGAAAADPPDGPLVSRNVYWMHGPGGDFGRLPGWGAKAEAKLTATVAPAPPPGPGLAALALSLANPGGPGGVVAFWVRVSVHRPAREGAPEGDTRVLPTRYSDNYLTLEPGERAEVALELPGAGLAGAVVRVEGWNAPSLELPVAPGGEVPGG